jgi:polysaccharide export outer membrane protein
VKQAILLAIFSISAISCCAQKESLTIGPGDLVRVTVLEAANLDQQVRVMDSGEIPLILGGNVKVTGLTPVEAARAIETTLIKGNFLLTPHVSVTMEHTSSKNITVVGQVRLPGSYELNTPRSILEALALAGGILDSADRKITIQRRETGQTIEYFLSNNSQAALHDVPQVFPGDVIVVPKSSFVYIMGDVGRPGAYPASTNDSKLSVLQALAFAGGVPPSGATGKIRLIRKTENNAYVEIPLPLKQMQKGKRSDFPLQADDILYVPFSYLRNIAVNIDGLIAATASASIYRF